MLAGACDLSMKRCASAYARLYLKTSFSLAGQ